MTESFVTPIEPEDLFALSQGIDSLLNRSRDLVNEAEAMDVTPDATIGEMAACSGLPGEVAKAVGRLTSDPDAAAGSANAAIRTERGLERAYYRAWQRCSRTPSSANGSPSARFRLVARLGEAEVEVAERVIYAVMKER